MNLEWSLIILCVAAAESLQDVSPGALLLVRHIGGPWRIQPVARLWGRAFLWQTLVGADVILVGGTAAARHTVSPDRLLAAVSSKAAGAFRLLCWAVFALMSFGLPYATFHHGLVGLVFGLCALVNVTLMCGIADYWVTRWLVRTLGLDRAPGRIAFVSPFRLLLSGGTALGRVVEGVGPASLLRVALDPAQLEMMLAPVLYDRPERDRSNPFVEVADRVLAEMPEGDRDLVFSTTKSLLGPRECMCPRCRSVFYVTVVRCPVCPNSPLLTRTG